MWEPGGGGGSHGLGSVEPTWLVDTLGRKVQLGPTRLDQMGQKNRLFSQRVSLHFPSPLKTRKSLLYDSKSCIIFLLINKEEINDSR